MREQPVWRGSTGQCWTILIKVFYTPTNWQREGLSNALKVNRYFLLCVMGLYTPVNWQREGLSNILKVSKHYFLCFLLIAHFSTSHSGVCSMLETLCLVRD